jgi:hypothetical protein
LFLVAAARTARTDDVELTIDPADGGITLTLLVRASVARFWTEGNSLETLQVGLVQLFEQFWHGDNVGAWRTRPVVGRYQNVSDGYVWCGATGGHGGFSAQTQLSGRQRGR